MVRSYWMGPVFGMLAVSGLAQGQSTPSVPAGAVESKDRMVVVQEDGKPPQRCKVLKTWTEPDGTPAFQVQALDTGELMTIEETGPHAPRPVGLAQSMSMRIFHWGRNNPAPVGAPEPPPNAVVVGYPIDIHPTPHEPTRIAAVPASPAQQPAKQWPSAHAQAPAADLHVGPDHLAPPPPPVIAPIAATAPAKQVELSPMAPPAVAANPTTIAPIAAVPVPLPEIQPAPAVAAAPAPERQPMPPAPAPTSPYLVNSATGPAGKPHDARPAWLPDSVASGSPYNATPANVKPAPVVVAAVPAPPTPAAPPQATTVVHKDEAPPAATPAPVPPPVAAKEPVAAMKVETTPAQPGDWRQSWGQVGKPPAAPAPVLASLPTDAPPPKPAPQTVAAPPKVELPHAVQRMDDPLSTPDRFARIPQTGGFDPDKSTTEKKAPLLAVLTLPPSPAAPKESQTTAPPPLPGPTPTTPAPAPTPVVKPAATLAPAPVVKPAPAAPQPVPAAPPQAAAPAVPLGMGSVLAAASPELAPPAPTPVAPEKAEVGIRANEPNAFSDRQNAGAVATAANAFSAPAAAPQPDALAMNYFPRPAPSYAPAATMRPAPPMAATASQAPISYVVRAGYQQDSGYSVSQLNSVLHESLYPSQREWAAETLAAMDWRRQPQIVDILVERAKGDPAPGVRAECLRSLGRMKADALGVVEAVKALQSDSNDEVRQAAVEAYNELTGAAAH